MQEVPADEQQEKRGDGACDPETETACRLRFYRPDDAISNQGNGSRGFGGRGGRSYRLGGYGCGYWYRRRRDANGWGSGRRCAWGECGCDFREAPGSVETVGDDLVIGGWQSDS